MSGFTLWQEPMRWGQAWLTTGETNSAQEARLMASSIAAPVGAVVEEGEH